MSVKKAVLLAAGKGTRMKELTNELPKPMLEVRGKPILLHIVEGLRAAGVTDFCIIVGYRAEVVRDFFGDGSKFGVRVSYATQVVQDGTGKVVELAREFAGSDAFVLSYGDILIDPANYARLTDLAGAEGIVTVKNNEGEMAKGGCVMVNDRFELIDLIEKPAGPAPSPWYNAGVYTFRPSIFDFTARRIRTDGRDPRPRAQRQDRACRRTEWRLGRCPGSRSARGFEPLKCGSPASRSTRIRWMTVAGRSWNISKIG